MLSRFVFTALLLSISCIGIAEDDFSPTSQGSDLNQDIRELQQSNQIYEQVIKNLIQRIEQLENTVRESGQADSPRKDSSNTPVDPEVREKLEQEIEENSRLIQSTFEQRLVKEGGVLLAKNQLTYEPGLSYAYSSYDKIVVDGFTIFPILVIGDIVSEKVDREIITINNSFRYGLGNDMQIDVFIPYGYRKEEVFRQDGFMKSKSTEGLGDISLGFSYQLIKAHSNWPDTVVGFNWKTSTGDDPYRQLGLDKLALGSGFDTFGLSFTSIAQNDPIVLFGGYSINYTEEENKEIGLVKPGLSHSFTLGMALALNFDTSLSFNLQFQNTGKTKIDGRSINGSDFTTSTFGVGMSIATGDSYAVDIDLAIGLTAASPDFQLTVSFPFNFTL